MKYLVIFLAAFVLVLVTGAAVLAKGSSGRSSSSSKSTTQKAGSIPHATPAVVEANAASSHSTSSTPKKKHKSHVEDCDADDLAEGDEDCRQGGRLSWWAWVLLLLVVGVVGFILWRRRR